MKHALLSRVWTSSKIWFANELHFFSQQDLYHQNKHHHISKPILDHYFQVTQGWRYIFHKKMKHLQKKVHLPDTMDTICKSRFPSPSLLGAVQQFEGWNITLLLQDISGAAINFAKELWEESAFGKSAKTYIPFVLHEMAVHREMAWCSQFRGNMSHLIALAHDTPRTRKCSRFTYFEFFAARGSEFWKKKWDSTNWRQKLTADFLIWEYLPPFPLHGYGPKQRREQLNLCCSGFIAGLRWRGTMLKSRKSHHSAVAHLLYTSQNCTPS